MWEARYFLQFLGVIDTKKHPLNCLEETNPKPEGIGVGAGGPAEAGPATFAAAYCHRSCCEFFLLSTRLARRCRLRLRCRQGAGWE